MHIAALFIEPDELRWPRYANGPCSTSAQCMHLPIGFLTGFSQGLHKAAAILIVQENVFAPVAPIHHMVNRPGIFQSQLSWHSGEHGTNGENMSIFIPDPFPTD